MKKLIFVVITLSLFSQACKKDNTETTIPDIKLTARQTQVLNNGNAFGFGLFRKVNAADPAKNIFISPLSISIALGMTLNGANGSTRTDMENALNLQGMTSTEINETYKSMIDYLRIVDPKVIFEIANSIWYKNSFPVEPVFLKTNQDYFYADINPLDFNNPASLSIINDWVSANTHAKISKIIDQINSDDMMYLINAIYFKGNWRYKFDPANTTPKSFYLEGGSIKETPMMLRKSTFNYFSNDNFSAVEMPYGNGRYSMYVFLPAQNKSTEDIISQLNPANWENWLNSFTPTEDVEIQFPKFRFEYEKKLNDILTDLGMGIAFTDRADFTGINSGGNLLITEVKHKTFVEVNEEGTEAAAVTSVGIGVTSVPQTTYFTVNKPFIFTIVEKQTKSIIFIGKIVDPLN